MILHDGHIRANCDGPVNICPRSAGRLAGFVVEPLTSARRTVRGRVWLISARWAVTVTWQVRLISARQAVTVTWQVRLISAPGRDCHLRSRTADA